MMDTVQEIPQPVCAKVHALATAAGCQLVATCDLAVAAETAALRHPRRQGRAVLPHAARRRGPQHRPQAGAGDGAHRRPDRRRAPPPTGAWSTGSCPTTSSTRPSTTCCAGRPAAARRRRRSASTAFYAQVDLPQDEAYAYAVEVMAAAALTPDAQEGIAAFLDKRPADFD